MDGSITPEHLEALQQIYDPVDPEIQALSLNLRVMLCQNMDILKNRLTPLNDRLRPRGKKKISDFDALKVANLYIYFTQEEVTEEELSDAESWLKFNDEFPKRGNGMYYRRDEFLLKLITKACNYDNLIKNNKK